MRKQFITLTVLIIFLFITSSSNAQIVISEIISPFLVEIQNQGPDTVNVDQFWLCDRPTYERIGSLNIECGSFNMPPGSFLIVTTNQLEMARDGDELGIYSSGEFNNPESIIDYVIWGNRGAPSRESVAVNAGIWTENERAPAYATDNSLLYDGTGDMASDFFLGESTACAENAICEVNGGQLSLEGGGTTIDICAGDGVSDAFEVVIDSAAGSNTAWIVTDTNGIILALPAAPPFDLETSGAGVCLIWHISFEDTLLELGLDINVSSLTGCFALSNSIRVNKKVGEDCPAPPCEVNGGNIMTSDSLTVKSICSNDTIEEPIQVDLSGASGTNRVWVVTDTNLRILSIDTSNVFNFDSSDASVCLIWHLSYEDGLTGAEVDSNAADLNGCFALSNSIRVIKLNEEDCPQVTCPAVGGNLAITGGATSIDICAGDGVSDAFDVVIDSAQGTNMVWVVTDTNNIILALPTSPPFDFEGSGPGICLIRNLVFEETLTGLSLDADINDIEGCHAFSNAITVNKATGEDCPGPACEVHGGSIILTDSSTTVTICVDDSESDQVEVNLSGATGPNNAWVVTDTNLVILSIDTNSIFNFDTAGAGVCLIWHISFEEGLIGAEVDSNAANLSGCFSLSNSITVNKLSGADCPAPPCEVHGGSIITQDSMTTVTICVDDEADGVALNLSQAVGSNSAWVVTDTNLTILSIDTTNIIDFDSSGSGTCLIWHLSYEDGLIGAEVGSNAANLSGCFSLSNSIIVRKISGSDCPAPPCEVNGGTIMTLDSMTVVSQCIDDIEEDLIEVTVSGATGTNNVWLVTDTNLSIISIDTNAVFNFESSVPSVCLIWHLSYEDGLEGVEVESNAGNLEGCFALSNAIRVNKLSGTECPGLPCSAMGGTLAISDGTTEVVVCGDAGSGTAVNVVLEGSSGARSAWVITDRSGMILGFPLAPPFNLSGARVGSYQIWHLSYDGIIIGASLRANINNLGGCFGLSNPIDVERVDVEPSLITFEDSSTVITICTGDGNADEINVIQDEAGNTLRLWVITDTDGMILGLPDTLPFNFETSGPGTCLIWLVTDGGDVTGLNIGANIDDLQGCHAISNSLTVHRNGVHGGTLTTEIGGTEVLLCVGDEDEDFLTLTIMDAEGANSAYVVTDTSGAILAVSANLDIDFNGFAAGICHVWHISSSDSLAGLSVGANVADLDGCFSLSNSVRVTKVSGADCPPPCTAQGGRIASNKGETEITICVDDNLSDTFELIAEDAAGENIVFIVTDLDGNIIGLNEDFSADLEGTGAGDLQVRLLAYSNDANIPEIGGNINTLFGCYALSNIFRINRVIEEGCSSVCVVKGGIVRSGADDSYIFCVDDGEADVLAVSLEGNHGDTSIFVITDGAAKIIRLSTESIYDFEGTGSGTCVIRNLSYTGSLVGLNVGTSTNDIQGCFDFSNTITITRLTGEDCPSTCTTDGGSISTIEGDTNIDFCAGDVLFTVVHDANGTDASAAYYYIVTDDTGTILEWRLSTEGGDFDLSRAPGGVCRVYGYDTPDGSLLEEGINIADLEIECAVLSSNYITVNRITGGACDEGCHTPRDIRFRNIGKDRWALQWDRVSEASGYILRVGFEGIPASFSDVPATRNRINLTGPPNRTLVIQVKSVCGANTTSDFSEEIVLKVMSNFGSNISTGRSMHIQHGLVLPSGIIITEQALAFPNPATDRITIWYDGQGVEGRLSIFDQTGRRVLNQRINGLEEFHEISIQELTDGIFFMMIEREGEILMQDKLIKSGLR